MIDKRIQKLIDPYLNFISLHLVRFGITANQITYFSLLFVIIVVVLLIYGETYLAIIFILLNRICDGLDGSVARINGITKFGGYLDILADYIFYISVPLGFALLSENNSFPTIVLLISYLLNSSSFFGLAAIKNFNKKDTNKKNKSFFYSFGYIEGTETILFYIIICIFPNEFTLLTYLFSCFVFLTAINRIIWSSKNI